MLNSSVSYNFSPHTDGGLHLISAQCLGVIRKILESKLTFKTLVDYKLHGTGGLNRTCVKTVVDVLEDSHVVYDPILFPLSMSKPWSVDEIGEALLDDPISQHKFDQAYVLMSCNRDRFLLELSNTKSYNSCAWRNNPLNNPTAAQRDIRNYDKTLSEAVMQVCILEFHSAECELISKHLGAPLPEVVRSLCFDLESVARSGDTARWKDNKAREILVQLAQMNLELSKRVSNAITKGSRFTRALTPLIEIRKNGSIVVATNKAVATCGLGSQGDRMHVERKRNEPIGGHVKCSHILTPRGILYGGDPEDQATKRHKKAVKQTEAPVCSIDLYDCQSYAEIESEKDQSVVLLQKIVDIVGSDIEDSKSQMILEAIREHMQVTHNTSSGVIPQHANAVTVESVKSDWESRRLDVVPDWFVQEVCDFKLNDEEVSADTESYRKHISCCTDRARRRRLNLAKQCRDILESISTDEEDKRVCLSAPRLSGRYKKYKDVIRAASKHPDPELGRICNEIEDRTTTIGWCKEHAIDFAPEVSQSHLEYLRSVPNGSRITIEWLDNRLNELYDIDPIASSINLFIDRGKQVAEKKNVFRQRLDNTDPRVILEDYHSAIEEILDVLDLYETSLGSWIDIQVETLKRNYRRKPLRNCRFVKLDPCIMTAMKIQTAILTAQAHKGCIELPRSKRVCNSACNTQSLTEDVELLLHNASLSEMLARVYEDYSSGACRSSSSNFPWEKHAIISKARQIYAQYEELDRRSLITSAETTLKAELLEALTLMRRIPEVYQLASSKCQSTVFSYKEYVTALWEIHRLDYMFLRSNHKFKPSAMAKLRRLEQFLAPFERAFPFLRSPWPKDVNITERDRVMQSIHILEVEFIGLCSLGVTCKYSQRRLTEIQQEILQIKKNNRTVLIDTSVCNKYYSTLP